MNPTVRQILVSELAMRDEIHAFSDVGTIVALYLDNHEYDGLYYDDGTEGCGCGHTNANFPACNGDISECRAGYWQKGGSIGPKEKSDD